MTKVILLCTLSLGFSTSVWSQSEVKVRWSDEQGCRFTLIIGAHQLENFDAAGISYSQIGFGGDFQTVATPQEPELPYRTIPLALPVGAEGRVAVEEGEFVELTDVRVRPVGSPTFGIDRMISSVSYIEGATYQQDAWLPERLAESTTPVLFQDWNTIYVTVSPVRYNPVQRRLRIYKNITVTVTFAGGNRAVAYRSWSGREDRIAQTLFLNHQTAKTMQVRSAATLLRKTANLLNTGTWYKIRISEEGVYKLGSKFFEDQGISLSTIDPRTIRIYNNGGAILPPLPPGLNLSDPSNPIGVSGLEFTENAIVVAGESDGKFDNNDYVLFYGRGNRHWKYDLAKNKYVYQLNYYSEENIYWLTFSGGVNGKRMAVNQSTGDNPIPQASFRDYFHFEKDEANFYESGLLWVSGILSPGQNAVYPANADMPSGGFIKDPVPEGQVSYSVRFKGATVESASHRFSVTVDGQGPFTTTTFTQGNSKFLNFSIPVSSLTQGRVSATYNPTSLSGKAALDWFETQYDRLLKLNDNELLLFSPITAGNYQYAIDTRGTDPGDIRVWDITSPSSVREILFTPGQGSLTFSDTVSAGAPKRYYLLASGRTKPVDNSQVSLDRNSDLQSSTHSADYIILTPRTFKDEADRLAQHRMAYDGFRTAVIDIEDVFDEFAGGIPDPTAIRDFLRYVYYRWETPLKNTRVSHVLLMSDADYDYRNIIVKSEHNWVPTYYIHSDYVTAGYFLNNRQVDEAFTWINDTQVIYEVDDPYAFPNFINYASDISIGRMPCSSLEEAAAAVTKTMVHETSGSLQAWRQTIGLVADDEIADASVSELNDHTAPTEALASDTSRVPGFLIRDKIYLIDFPFEWAGSRRRKLLARDALINRINQGALIINYVGHGNPKQLAHEEVYLHERDFPLIVNKDKYFLFTNFSCSFAMFDQLEVQGGGEALVVAKDRGCFGLLAATRAVYAGPNIQLMNQIFRSLKTSGVIGEAVRLGKVAMGNSSYPNHQKYNYLGDPATSVHYTTRNAQFDLAQPALLKAMNSTTLVGLVGSESGVADPGFNGDILVSVFDRALTKRYTTPYETLDYKLEPSVLYRGKIRVTGGTFSTTFIVPKDLSYSYQNGSVVAYGSDGSNYAGGFSTQILIDSTSSSIPDSIGPSMRIQFEGQAFTSGDVVPRNPLMNLHLSDTSGINLTGSMGHKIQLAIDDRFIYDLSDFFAYDVNSYRSGSAQINLYGLAIGRHTAKIVAFDNANNASSHSFAFEVIDTEDDNRNQTRIALSQLMNYPNPFRSSTNFTFIVSHSSAEVRIAIYTISGKLIRKLDGQAIFGFNSIPWDGRDEDGNRMANGVYLYKVKVTSLDNATESQTIGKLMIAK